MTDMTGKKHAGCYGGRFKETGFHDNMDGVLHCTKCGERTERYPIKDYGLPSVTKSPPMPPCKLAKNTATITISKEQFLDMLESVTEMSASSWDRFDEAFDKEAAEQLTNS
tara:strand:+ start:1318 stop:1650 length:333 start_codon:yes stop_codon:yes gene_type:complete